MGVCVCVMIVNEWIYECIVKTKWNETKWKESKWIITTITEKKHAHTLVRTRKKKRRRIRRRQWRWDANDRKFQRIIKCRQNEWQWQWRQW